MIRVLTLLLLLSACAAFPQVDAAAPRVIPPGPAYLTPAELARANAQALLANQTMGDSGAALRLRAADLRAKPL